MLVLPFCNGVDLSLVRKVGERFYHDPMLCPDLKLGRNAETN
jgi:hypothetical protein